MQARVIGWGLIGMLIASTVLISDARAQRMDQRVRVYVDRMAREVPSATMQRRVARYEPLIRYFTGLSYTQPGVTVSTPFVRALVAAESAGDATAVSHKGAIGLMQIMPATARPAARALYETGYDFRYIDEARLRSITEEDLKTPAINLLIGCYLLDRYNGQFGNDLAKTVSAWNAGPRSVDRYDGAPPYRETLELIGRVNAYYVFFNRRQQSAAR
jgi:soluble lytic murein transglycosylase-like protein